MHVFASMLACVLCIFTHTLFFCNTSNFGAEAELSSIFLRFEAESALKTVLKLHGMHYLRKSMRT